MNEANDIRSLMKNSAPLEIKDLIGFLQATGRSEECPFCHYRGAWDIHVDLPLDDSGSSEMLSVFAVPAQRENDDPHTCVGMTCNQCGHFSLISVYKIRQYQAALGKGASGE